MEALKGYKSRRGRSGSIDSARIYLWKFLNPLIRRDVPRHVVHGQLKRLIFGRLYLLMEGVKILVEWRRIELPTFALRTRRSPS